MKFVSFNKYKAYLESSGYVQEKGTNEYYDANMTTYLFSKPGEKLKYLVNVFRNTDKVISIANGYGSPYLGWDNVIIDMRKKFWKNLCI